MDGRGERVQAHVLDLKDKLQGEKAAVIQDMRAVPVGQDGVLLIVATLSHMIAMVGQGSGREMLAPYRRQGGITRRNDTGVRFLGHGKNDREVGLEAAASRSSATYGGTPGVVCRLHGLPPLCTWPAFRAWVLRTLPPSHW